MFSTIKLWIAGVISAGVAIFAIVFAMRGSEIEDLKEEVAVKNKKAKVAAKVTEDRVAIAKFEAANAEAHKATEEANEKKFEENFPIGKKFYV